MPKALLDIKSFGMKGRTMVCRNINDEYQPFPTKDDPRLFANRNLSYEGLRKKLSGVQGTVYCYVIDTTKWNGERLIQKGCGPNFQGDLITLCTCKHYMRCFMEPKAWEKEKWIAGFTGKGKKAGQGKNVLVYLMEVDRAFKSHYELWSYLRKKDNAALEKKMARNCKFGDIYEPKDQQTLSDVAQFRWGNYVEPCKGHCHNTQDKKNGCKLPWHKDINYRSKPLTRRPALLVGDPTHSFLWHERHIYLNEKTMTQGQKKYESFNEFLNTLASEKKS